jgi:hypothetical protein
MLVAGKERRTLRPVCAPSKILFERIVVGRGRRAREAEGKWWLVDGPAWRTPPPTNPSAVAGMQSGRLCMADGVRSKIQDGDPNGIDTVSRSLCEVLLRRWLEARCASAVEPRFEFAARSLHVP